MVVYIHINIPLENIWILFICSVFTSDDPCLDQPAPETKPDQEDTEGNQVDLPCTSFLY